MLLAIDVGNTNIAYGLFNERKLIRVWREPTPTKEMRDVRCEMRGGNKRDIDAVIISSVVPRLDKVLEKSIRKQLKLKPVFATHKNIGLRIKLKEKAQVGADRLVNAYAVSKLYGYPAIIVDFGTATTFCAVNSKGEYLGGAIAPGIRLSAEALHFKTAKLPLIDFGMAEQSIGGDTKSAMLSGLYFGYISLVEGMIARFRKEIGAKARVIATGGYSSLIGKKTRIFDIIDPDLTLKGLRIVWEDMNVRRVK